MSTTEHEKNEKQSDETATGAAEAGASVEQWFHGRLPQDWFTEPAEVVVDREEITVIGRIPEPDGGSREAAEGRTSRFREETRQARIEIAREAEHRYGRKVAWGVRCGEVGVLFTHLAVPVMTRLRQPERRVLDTLVEANVARSRADALAWCVRLVGDNTGEWLDKLREATEAVRTVREEGPDLS